MTCMDKLRDLKAKAQTGDMTACREQRKWQRLTGLREKFEAAMEDDFNTADAVSAVFELVKLANSTADDDSTAAYVKGLEDLISRSV